MKIRDIVPLIRPWNRLKISEMDQMDVSGARVWTDTLTEAQIYAYWNWDVISSRVEEETHTVYCIVRKCGG